MTKIYRNIIVCNLILFSALIMFSCNSAKQVAYFQDVPDTTGLKKVVPSTAFVEPVINVGDVLDIQITTIDAKFGDDVTSVVDDKQEVGSIATPKGYVVDKDGYIEMPLVGRVKLSGLTTQEAKKLIRQKALVYYKEPLVNVRISNFVVTVYGEVSSPGRFVVPTEKLSVLDAIGLAGDLLITGKRENIMIIRQKGDQTLFTRVNLNSTDIFNSEYFYLQSGDKVYVEPLETVARTGTRDTRGDRILSIGLGMISIAIAVTSILIRVNN